MTTPIDREEALRTLGVRTLAALQSHDVDPSTTDAEGDADRNARATGPDAAQAARGRDLDLDADRRASR